MTPLLIASCTNFASSNLTVEAVCDAWRGSIVTTAATDRRALKLSELDARQTYKRVCQ